MSDGPDERRIRAVAVQLLAVTVSGAAAFGLIALFMYFATS